MVWGHEFSMVSYNLEGEDESLGIAYLKVVGVDIVSAVEVG
jgi:hypothetical protein